MAMRGGKPRLDELRARGRRQPARARVCGEETCDTMTRVAILPVHTPSGELAYHATAGEKQSLGKTAGEALDAIASQLREDDAGTLVVVQHQRPDAFFTEKQQKRLGELMERWREARDSGTALSNAEQAELDALVEDEIRASSERMAALLRDTA